LEELLQRADGATVTSSGAANDDEKTHHDVLEVGEYKEGRLLKGLDIKITEDDVPQ
jgi:hypothetical protein